MTSRKIESNILNLQHRIDIDILNDMEKMRTDCFQHYNYNNENEERLLERIKALGESNFIRIRARGDGTYMEYSRARTNGFK